MHPKMLHTYVGVDTHRFTHTAVVIDCFGEKLGEVTFENKPSAFPAMLKEIKTHSGKDITPAFGLEDVGTNGRALAVFLLGKDEIVKYVNPSLTKSERSNQTILHKTDSFDGLCIARILLNHFNELPKADPQDIFWTLSQLVAKRRAIVKACTALKNQAHAFIIHHYPSYNKYFFNFSCKTALDFWEKYPSPAKLKNTSVEELARFLKLTSHNNCAEEKAVQILDCVKNDGDTLSEYQDKRDFLVTLSMRELKHNLAVIAEIEVELKSLMDILGYKLDTMKGIDIVTAAALVAEIGDINRFSSADKLAKYAGLSPVTYASGKTDKHYSNRRGNRILNGIFFNIAIIFIIHGGNGKSTVNPIFYDYYHKKISEGKTKKQALKAVMRRLVNIIYGMLKNKTEYINPSLPKQKAE